MKQFAMHHAAISGHDSSIIVPSDTVFFRPLVADVEMIVAVPAGANIVLFDSGSDFWVKYDETVTIPTIAEDTSSDRNPSDRLITNVTNIHIMSGTTSDIVLAFYG